MILCFQVTVRDNGRPPLSSTTRVVIEVMDVNDHGPVFEQKFYTVQIPASPATDKPLFQVQISSNCSARYNIAFSIGFPFIRVSCKYISTPRNGPEATEQKRVAYGDPNLSPKQSCFLRCCPPPPPRSPPCKKPTFVSRCIYIPARYL